MHVTKLHLCSNITVFTVYVGTPYLLGHNQLIFEVIFCSLYVLEHIGCFLVVSYGTTYKSFQTYMLENALQLKFYF
jgi:hypothetical protein